MDFLDRFGKGAIENFSICHRIYFIVGWRAVVEFLTCNKDAIAPPSPPPRHMDTRKSNKPGHDARAVANYLIRRAMDDNKPLTNMQVQKLAYFSQAWVLALTDRQLFEQDVVAWTWGPVVIDVYESLKKYGRNEVDETIDCPDEEFDKNEQSIMNQVYEQYGSLDAFELSDLTHQPSAPWATTWRNGGMGKIISKKMIKSHYEKIVRWRQRGRSKNFSLFGNVGLLRTDDLGK